MIESQRRPLTGQTIAVTRMADQASFLSNLLCAAGAEVIEAPTIELAELDDYTAVDQALRDLVRYDWLVVTSVNGVDSLWKRMKAIGVNWIASWRINVAAVGVATAGRCEEYGIRPHLVPEEAVGEALADAMIRDGVAGRRVLLLRSEIARSRLPQLLRDAGAFCDDLAIYRTVQPDSLPLAFLEKYDANGIDWIALTSPSSLNNLLILLGNRREKLRAIKLASIGPVTSRAIRQAGFKETVEAEPHDIPALVDAIVRASGSCE